MTNRPQSPGRPETTVPATPARGRRRWRRRSPSARMAGDLAARDGRTGEPRERPPRLGRWRPAGRRRAGGVVAGALRTGAPRAGPGRVPRARARPRPPGQARPHPPGQARPPPPGQARPRPPGRARPHPRGRRQVLPRARTPCRTGCPGGARCRNRGNIAQARSCRDRFWPPWHSPPMPGRPGPGLRDLLATRHVHPTWPHSIPDTLSEYRWRRPDLVAVRISGHISIRGRDACLTSV